MAVDNANLDFLVRKLKYPKSALFNKVLAKEMISKNAHLDAKERGILTKDVNQINWVFLLKADNSRINEYYGDDLTVKEINLISVSVSPDVDVKMVATIILKSIPKITILDINWRDDNGKIVRQWASARYHMQRGKNNMVAVDNIVLSSHMSSLNEGIFVKYLGFAAQVNTSLKAFQTSVLTNIEKFNYYSDHGTEYLADGDVAEVNKNIAIAQKELNALLTKAKNEKQLNKRVEIVRKIKQLKTKIKDLEK